MTIKFRFLSTLLLAFFLSVIGGPWTVHAQALRCADVFFDSLARPHTPLTNSVTGAALGNLVAKNSSAGLIRSELPTSQRLPTNKRFFQYEATMEIADGVSVPVYFGFGLVNSKPLGEPAQWVPAADSIIWATPYTGTNPQLRSLQYQPVIMAFEDAYYPSRTTAVSRALHFTGEVTAINGSKYLIRAIVHQRNLESDGFKEPIWSLRGDGEIQVSEIAN